LRAHDGREHLRISANKIHLLLVRRRTGRIDPRRRRGIVSSGKRFTASGGQTIGEGKEDEHRAFGCHSASTSCTKRASTPRARNPVERSITIGDIDDKFWSQPEKSRSCQKQKLLRVSRRIRQGRLQV